MEVSGQIRAAPGFNRETYSLILNGKNPDRLQSRSGQQQQERNLFCCWKSKPEYFAALP
jgi:hypothetical protein